MSRKLRKVLVTGFDPFGGELINPSWEVVQRLPDQLGKLRLVKAQLPTSFARAPKALLQLAKQHQPNVIVCLGQAGGRNAITPERVAINVMDTKVLADNDGDTPVDEAIRKRGATALFASLPIKHMVAAVQAAGISAEISNSAGTFVCNCVMYQALHWAKRNDALAGFIHIPYLPQQGIANNAPSMPMEMMVDGITHALSALE